MSNPFYGPSGSPVNQSRGSSAQVRAEFDLVEAGFTAVDAAILGITTSAISAILPSQAGKAGYILSTNGTTVSWIENIPAVAAYASNSGQLGGVAANGYALLSGATFTGATNVVNVAAGNNTTLAANTAFVTAAVAQAKADIVDSSPAALDTLNEFAIALGNDANFATTTATALGNRLRVDTAAQGLNSTQKSNAVTNLGLAAVASSGLKADVGLSNVDNTSDANKPVSTAQAVINAARVTGVTATAPVVSSGGMAPVISMPASTTSANGYLTAADWNTFNGKAPLASPLFTGYVTNTDAGIVLNTTSANAGARNFAIGQIVSFGRIDVMIGATLGSNALSGTSVAAFSATGLAVAGGVTATSYTGSGGSLTGLTASQINTALGFTPYNSTNPSGYISSITSGNVTTALGFTPYNSTNPSGYIASITSSNVTTALGFTPANAAGQAFTGNISAPVVTQTSNERKKKNWQRLSGDFIEKFASIKKAGLFQWRKGGAHCVGVGAQSLEVIMPAAVHTDEKGDKSVNTGGAALAIAHELSREVVKLRARLAKLESAK